MKSNNFLLILLLATITSFGQEKASFIDIHSEGKPRSGASFNNNPRNFHFVVMPDHTGAHRSGILKKGVDRINLLQPEFVVSIGDLIEGYTHDSLLIENQWKEFNTSIQNLTMPFFYVAGNHDFTNRTMEKIWLQKYGTPYYYFIYKNVLFLCLNTEDGTTALKKPDLSDEQLSFVEKTLAAHSGVEWTMVFMHQPLWMTPTATNWKKTERLLSSRKHSVFTGHTHQYALHHRNNSDYFVLSTMGGVNSLRGKEHGEFDHFLWVTMTTDGPVYANIMLDGVEDKSVQTAEKIERELAFSAQPPVRFEPFYYTGKPGKKATWKMEMCNHTTENYHCEVQLKAGKGLIPDQTSFSNNLKAGTKEETSISATIAEKDNHTPIIADIKLRSERYEWKSRVHVLPYKKLVIEDVKKPILPDGDLSEWGTLRFAKQDSVGTTGFRFDVRKDSTYIYVGVDVTDNDIQAPSVHANLNQDGTFVVFDARPLSKSAFNHRTPDGMGREWLFMLASPTADTFELGFKEHMPPGITGKGRKTSKGYAIEYTIPLALVQKLQGSDWQTIRINVILANQDKGAMGAPRKISWTPDWTENYPGSGMFFRKE